MEYGFQSNGCIRFGKELIVVENDIVEHAKNDGFVSYPACPNISIFKDFLEKCNCVRVIVGTHPIRKKYLDLHTSFGTWQNDAWQQRITLVLGNEDLRKQYD